MPRQRSPNRDKAYELWKESEGTIELIEIAKQLDIPEGTIRGWKNKDDWNRTLQKNTERSKKHGGQPGNKNAVGNSGGAAPLGNVNAVKHGAYQNLYSAYLPPEERELYEQMPSASDLDAEIKLLRLKIARLSNREIDFFYDQFGVKHIKEISEEDREKGIIACTKQLEKLIRTQEQNRTQQEKLQLEKKKLELMEQRQNGGEWEEDLSRLDDEIYGSG